MHDDDLKPYCEQLGIPGLFDVHVHFMHPRILAKVWSYFDSVGPLLGRPWPIHYRWSDDERVAHLRSMGVQVFSALSYAHRPGVAPMMNAWTAQFADAHPDNLRSATFYPEPEAADYVPALVEEGAEVFKAHQQVGDFAADDPLLDPVWNTLREARIPTVLHAGSGPAPGRHTGPAGVARLLEKYPDLPLIIAHLGMPEGHEFCDLAERYENVLLDTTMVFVDFWGDPIDEALVARVERLRPKILFGTDFPNIPYAYAHQVEVLQRLDLGDDWMRSVLWHNAADLLGATPHE